MENTDWFGVVRWCDEDIANALFDSAVNATAENISTIRRKCEHHSFTDAMIERGWEMIYYAIEEARRERSLQ